MYKKGVSTIAIIILKMKEAADHTLSKNINLKHLDLGGGFAVNYKKIKNTVINYKLYSY